MGSLPLSGSIRSILPKYLRELQARQMVFSQDLFERGRRIVLDPRTLVSIILPITKGMETKMVMVPYASGSKERCWP